ncbi:hypothetical protein [Algoriphagus yeomjeoni]|uniref:Outer membrane protein with beta-barrel domain n=1 Tax=Algoriphagus yeomjeoni TaxID=291403 RepID=A0A327P7P7_9BACT|nr:hypothetical protein [Algoriphagus yeomjeoni]RAI88280.1 hypothetical protein LV83_02580 [Algoriphagus yeomjeoni]
MNRKSYLLFIGLLLLSFESMAQEGKYFGQTEIGILYGRSAEQWDGNHEERTDLTLLTFHGMKISRSHVVGFSVGLDQYDGVPILPFAFGYRGFLGKEGKPKIFGGVDLGYGSAMLEKREENEWSKSWYRGGLMFSPSVGFSFPALKGNSALSLSLAYKRQDISYFQGFLTGPGAQTIVSDQLPPGFSSLSKTENLYRSFVFRAGLMF